jgi:hypothetical protein
VDGQFKVRIPGDRPVTLVPRHPLLRPADEGGTVTLTKPRDGVVLKLEIGTLAEYVMDPRLAVYDPCRALLFQGDPIGDPVGVFEIVAGWKYRFGGHEPGQYTIFLDVPRYAPVVLRDRTLGEGKTDLGEIRFEAGSCLRVRFEPMDEEAPRYWVVATHQDAPSYDRWVKWEGEKNVLLTGLGAGTFRVWVKLPHRPETLAETTIWVDGRNDAEVVFDLR